MIEKDYLKDAQGRFIPIDQVKDIDLARNELVREKIKKIENVSNLLRDLKKELLDDIKAFTDLSAEKYGVSLGGKYGNITLRTFDGTNEIKVAVAKNMIFDERILAAKALVDQCIKRWAEGADKNLHVLVDDAFQVDKEGKINTQRVLSLTKIDIDDNTWQQAMTAIKDSLSVMNTTTYVRAYERLDKDGAMQQIPMDLAGV